MRFTGQFSKGADTGQLHLLIDCGRTHIQRPPKNVGEAQDVIDLIGIVGAASSDNRIGPSGLGFFRHDFGNWISQRQNQRLDSHRFDHRAGQHPGLGQTQKHVRTHNGVSQGAS